MKKQVTAVLAAAILALSAITGCAKGQDAAQTGAAAETKQAAETAAQNAETAAQQTETAAQATPASANDSASKDTAILAVSFGTSYNDNRDATIGAIEKAIADEFPQYEVRRAFTSQIIIDKLKERDGLVIDNVEEALDRAVADGIKTLIVQPTHLMDGYEYTDLANALSDYESKFDKVVLGEPLLSSEADFDKVVAAITKKMASYDDGGTAICFMGHGTEADSNAVYAKMQDKLVSAGYENYFIGTVEAPPTFEDMLAALKAKGKYKKVVLEPLMVVAGDHANNDMAGNDEGSWKTTLQNEGYEVECILEGLGQMQEIRDIYVEHTRAAVEEATQASAKNAIYADDIKDGEYAVLVESSSSMFRIVKAVLKVANGSMTADLTLSGHGYLKLFMGTGEDALKAGEESYIGYVEDADGAYTYTIPVEALNQEFDCAAYSKRKETWYDRKLVIWSSSLPNDALNAVLEDGDYAVEITLSGGSNRASVASPARLSVSGGKAVVFIEWSSPNYDYMLVDGVKYLPVNTEGNSVFEIPVAAFDEEVYITADTTAMSVPHEIEYTLIFHSDTLRKTGESSLALQYADRFSLEYYDGKCILISVADGRKYLVVPEGERTPDGIEGDIVVLKRPLDNIYLVSSAAMDMFCELDALSAIRFSGQKSDAWSMEKVREAMKNGDILYAGKYNMPDYELIVSGGCSLAIENNMISHSPEVVEKLAEFGIPALVDLSSYESHPLGRAEWIKLYGVLLGRQEEAQEIFDRQVKLMERASSSEASGKTVAFFYITTDDKVNVRVSSDYVPKMIELAGGKYIFDGLGDDKNARSSMMMQMEEFYNRAKDADYIIYNSTIDGGIKSVDELIKKEALLNDFKAVKNGNVWCAARDMYQHPMSIGQMIDDMHNMLSDDENARKNIMYLYHVD